MEQVFAIISGVLLFVSQLAYIKSVLKTSISPHILSWYGWSLLIFSAWFSQFLESGWEWSSFSVLLSGFGCFAIATTGLVKKHFIIQKKDWIFLGLGMLSMILYLVSKNQWATTIFAISADFLLAIPMLLKAIKNPYSEKSSAWYFSLGAWTISLGLSFFEQPIFLLMPIYLFLFSVAMVYLMHRKTKN